MMTDDAEKTANQKVRDINVAQTVINTELKALNALSESIGEEFAKAVDLIINTSSYVIVAGIGKSGHIGRKIAATFASTGTPSFFVHPTEASHGDLGMLHDGSVIIAISNSGSTRELRDIIVHCTQRGLALIAITSVENSFLGKRANVNLVLPTTQEACPNHLAPTSSTTMTIALGDALAIAAMERRGFTADDFSTRHPGGSLGMRIQSVQEWVSSQHSAPNPTAHEDELFIDILHSISDGRCGAVSIVDDNGFLAGIITDGDIRRAVENFESTRSLRARQLLNSKPTTVSLKDRIGGVIDLFESLRISQAIVVEKNSPIAMIHIKDLMHDGYF